MIEAVIFDIDNTLTDDVSWLRSTELMGADPGVHRQIFEKMLQNELTYEQAKAQLIQLWRDTGNANHDYWQSMFVNWPLKQGAVELVNHAQSMGLQTAIITGSYDLFAAAIAKKLNIGHYYANTLTRWDEEGNLLDFDYTREQAARKLEHLRKFCTVAGIAMEQCVAVGDGENDVEIFKATRHGIAVSSEHQPLVDVAEHVVGSLTEVAPLLSQCSK